MNQTTGTELTRLLSSPSAAAYLGIKPQTLRKWRVHGCGPRYVRMGDSPGARVAYRETDLREWLDRRSYGSTAEESVGAST